MHNLLIRTISGAWLGVGLVWLIGSLNTKPALQVQSVVSRAVHVLPVILAFVLLFADWPTSGPLAFRIVPATIFWASIGTVLALAGIVFAIVARFVIGRNWSSAVTVKQDHEMVQSGPYRIVRHPIYSGFLLAILGTAIAFGEVRDFLAFVLALTGWKIKSLGEERFMLNRFGTKYSEYSRRVKGLVPCVW